MDALQTSQLARDAEPLLRALQRRQIPAEILRATGVELVLVEVFGVLVARLPAIGSLQRTFAGERGERPLDPRPFAGQQFPCPLRIHARQLSW